MRRPSFFPTLTTARLELRAPVGGDAGELFAIFSDPEVMRYWSTPPMVGLAQAEALVDETGNHFLAGTGLRWAVCRPDDGRVIGTASLFHFDFQNSRAEIGYALGRGSWGQGFMNEALVAVIGFAFGEMDLRRLEADADPRNAASIRTLERLGFVREGLLRERWVVAGVVSDSAIFGLLRRGWEARQGARESRVKPRD